MQTRHDQSMSTTWLSALAALLVALGLLLLLITWLFLLPDADGDGGANELPRTWRIVQVLLSLVAAGGASAGLIALRSGSRRLLAAILLAGSTVATASWLVVYAAR